MTGNISLFEGKSYIHTHCVISNEYMKCLGGHVESALVGPTVEISLVALDLEINRKFDSEVGLNLMDF